MVNGRDKSDVVVLLDRMSDANGLPVKEITDADEFMVHFRLADSGYLKLESFDEPFYQDVVMPWAYPILNKSFDPKKDGYPREAVQAERKRVKQKVTKEHPILNEYKTVAKRTAVAQGMGSTPPAQRSRRKGAGEAESPTQSDPSAEM